MASESIAHSAFGSWAVDSEPIRARGIIVKYSNTLIKFQLLIIRRAMTSNLQVRVFLYNKNHGSFLNQGPVVQSPIELILHTYIHLYSKFLKRRVWRLTLYYNSPEKIKVKCVQLCTENFQISKIKKKKIYLRFSEVK